MARQPAVLVLRVREDGPLMKAVRWILFALVAFAAGTGVALAVHPPTVGIPSASADALSDDLAKVREYAASGQCDAVRGRLRGADATIDDLPPRTSAATLDQLSSSLRRVRSEALSTCQQVYQAAQDREQAQQEQEATTPEETTAPEATPQPEPTPDAGDGGTTPDGGLAPDAGGTQPVDPGAGAGGGQGDQGQGDDGGSSGGVGIPNGAAIRQSLEAERAKIEDHLDRAREAWGGR